MAASKLIPVSDDFTASILHADAQLFSEQVAKLNEEPKAEERQVEWYELDVLIPYHDFIAAIGFVFIVACVASYSWRASLGVAGMGLMALGWLMGRNV